LTKDKLKQEIKELFSKNTPYHLPIEEWTNAIDQGLDDLLSDGHWKLPDEWKLVPRQPTPDMDSAVDNLAKWPHRARREWFREVYMKFLEAAPTYQIIDLDLIFWERIVAAAKESKWMPPEYMMNDWVEDVCVFLKAGRVTPVEPRTPADIQKRIHVLQAEINRLVQEILGSPMGSITVVVSSQSERVCMRMLTDGRCAAPDCMCPLRETAK
jgi:hypothetical protein